MGFKPRGTTFGVTREWDQLYDRGWPYLRVLTDEPIERKRTIRDAKKALEAIDPYLPTHVPLDLARRYLRGYLVLDPFAQKDDVKRAISNDEAPIDRAWLAEILAKKIGPSPSLGYGGETYTFRLAEVIFLFEAFLGTRVVAEALVVHLTAARDNPAWWGDPYFRDHENAAPRRLVPILGWLRLRMPDAEWGALIRPLTGEQAALPGYVGDLATLLDDARSLDDVHRPEWIAMQRRDRAWLRSFLDRAGQHWGYWNDPQIYYVVGADALGAQPVDKLTRLPKWQQRRIVDEFGTIGAPQATRVIEGLVASRSAGEAAASWLAARGASAPEPAAIRSQEELEAELSALFAGLGSRLQQQGGDAEKERAVLDQSFAAYCEIRAALDDPTPEAYFTHRLADVCSEWDVDEETAQRWIDLAVEAASG